MWWTKVPGVTLCATVATAILSPVTAADGVTEADAAIETCLAEGTIVKREKTLEGVTRPTLYSIDCSGEPRRAIFKQVDEQHRGLTRFEEGTWEMNFSDSYRYERAAYLLDREMGLNMVPVAVIREVKRQEGALIEWLEHTSTVEDSPHEATPREVAELARQKSMMRLFDALIYNTDRNVSNYLVDDQDWHLHLIDHSRAFREVGDLPEAYLETQARLPRELYARLQGLDEEALVEKLEGLLSRGQIQTLLERRDKLLEKIDADREKLGDQVVFWS